MRYNIEFRNERGSYGMKECTKPITQELIDTTVKFLEGWDIGHTKQIVIDILEEKPDVKISMETRLCECGLSRRAINGMKCIGIRTVSDLLSVTRSDLLKTHYIGKKTLSEIDKFVKDNGFEFKQIKNT